VPGLLGLPRDYINAQLGGWRTGQRSAQAPDCMRDIARRLSSQDVAAVTHWLAAQPVPANSQPLAALPPLKAGAKALHCGSSSLPVPPATETTVAMPSAQVTQGAYLARVGNCEQCHTALGGKPYAGQRAITTPFGTAYSTNLTPDNATGLGQWTAPRQIQGWPLVEPGFPLPQLHRREPGRRGRTVCLPAKSAARKPAPSWP
jgi:hypothetical protein